MKNELLLEKIVKNAKVVRSMPPLEILKLWKSKLLGAKISDDFFKRRENASGIEQKR